VVSALGPLVLEASLFEEASGAVVEERGRDLLLFLHVSRVTLHDATTGLGDEVQCTS
jgi:hypothetical protein